ncbi:MAG: patatin [Deltaproteobacteria bacterium]|nr:MAG: patatin [Deltaproteobacteria bacterium]
MSIDSHWGKNRVISTVHVVIIVCAIIIWSSVIVFQVDASDSKTEERLKIGLVLSGGGARGAAHIGVIKVLERMHIPIDYIAGTSMGSIVGGLYASGMTSAQIEGVVTSLDWDNALQDDIPRKDRSFRLKTDDRNNLIKSKPGLSDNLEIKTPSGLMQGQILDLILKRLVLPVSSVHDFDELKIPYRAIATDLVTGNAVVLGSGDLAKAMRASMSVPAIFAPVEIDGKLLVDGGLSNNLPIDVVRTMGADIVIAVDISTPLLAREALTSILGITEQLTSIMTRKNTEEQIATLTSKDVFIVPDLGDITSSSFDRTGQAIPIGVLAAEQKQPELLRLSSSKAFYTDFQALQLANISRKKRASNPIIEFIRLDNQSRLSDDVIFARLQIKEGSPLDIALLEENIGKIYGLELFENVSYEVVEEDGRSGLVIQVIERFWGPNYLQAGFTMSGNGQGDNFYNFTLAYTRTAINHLNGEWRTAVQLGKSSGIYTEIFQPLDTTSQFFIHPRLLYHQDTMRFSPNNNDNYSEYRLERYGVDLALGREFGTWGASRIGIRRMKGHAKHKVGLPYPVDEDFNIGEIYANISFDKLDDLDFPRTGYASIIEYIMSDGQFGADSDFDQILLQATGAKTWGKNTLITGMKVYLTLDDNAPLQNRFQLGGLFNLSGFQTDELSGQSLSLLRMIYMRQISDFLLLPTYVGFSFESGNTWEKIDNINFADAIFAGSIFLGVDTPIGPVYIGYGQAENNNSSIYFKLGKIF